MRTHRAHLLFEVAYCPVGCSCHERDWEVIATIDRLLGEKVNRRRKWWEE